MVQYMGSKGVVLESRGGSFLSIRGLLLALAVVCGYAVPGFALSLPPPPPPDTSGEVPPRPRFERPVPRPTVSPPGNEPVVPPPTTEPRRSPVEATHAAPRPRPAAPEDAPSTKPRLEMGGRLQVDSRAFHFRYSNWDADAGRSADLMDIRRARIDLRIIQRDTYEVKLSAEFGGGKTKLEDGYVDWHLFGESALRLGQFDYPFGNEPQRSSQYTMFIEKSMAAALADGGRDRGISLQGGLFDRLFTYQLAAMQGAGDNRLDSNDAADGVARLVFRVWGEEGNSGLWVGGSYVNGLHRSLGDEIALKAESRSGAGPDTAHPGVSYFKATIGKGIDYYVRKIGYEATAVFEPVNMQVETFNLAYSIEHPVAIKGGYVAASWVLGGGRRNFRQGNWRRAAVVAPITRHGAGAWELAARYSWAEVDPRFFEDNGLYEGWVALNSPPSGTSGVKQQTFYTRKLQAFTVGVNWAPDTYTTIMFNWVVTTTDGIASALQNQNTADESAYVLRCQVEF